MKTIAIVLLLASTAVAQNQVVVQLSQSEGLLVKSAAPITVERIAIQQIGAPVVVTPPVDTTETLEQVVRKAHDAVPEYANKDKHCSTIAFTINFLSQGISGDSSSDAAKATVTQAVNGILAADADKWSGFFAAVNARTAGQTASQYSASLKTIAQAMCADMGAESVETEYGVESFGLDKEFLAELMKILLPLLLKLLAGL